MYNSFSSKKGMSLIEVLIALFLLTVGVLALLTLQPRAWSLSGKSDYLGRAAGILHQELEANEMLLMNRNAPAPASNTRTVRTSGLGVAQPGDATFQVATSILDNLNGTWLITVTVTWPGNPTGLSESRFVTRQQSFS